MQILEEGWKRYEYYFKNQVLEQVDHFKYVESEIKACGRIALELKNEKNSNGKGSI